MDKFPITLHTNDPQNVVVYFPADALAMSLPVTELGEHLIRLEAIPFMTDAANFRDIIEVTRRTDGALEFRRVIEQSHWRIFTFVLAREGTESTHMQAFCSRLSSMGCYWERDFGGWFLVGVPPDMEVDLNDILAQMRGAIQ